MNETNGIEAILEQARLLVVQHAPVDALASAIPFAIVCLVAGVGLSVLGAKLSRFGTASAFAFGGAGLGQYIGQQAGYPTILCALIGAVLVGTIGYQTFRVWVGFGVALVLSTVALGAFGYERILPRVAEYEQTTPHVSVQGGAGNAFTLPSPAEQDAYRVPDPRTWVANFWGYVTQQDQQAEPKARAVGLTALVVGLCVGLLAMRTALIFSTSLVGTGLVTTSIATLVTRSVPDSYQAFEHHPKWIGIGVGAFFVASLLVQTLLTREAPGKSKSKSKTASAKTSLKS